MESKKNPQKQLGHIRRKTKVVSSNETLKSNIDKREKTISNDSGEETESDENLRKRRSPKKQLRHIRRKTKAVSSNKKLKRNTGRREKKISNDSGEETESDQNLRIRKKSKREKKIIYDGTESDENLKRRKVGKRKNRTLYDSGQETESYRNFKGDLLVRKAGKISSYDDSLEETESGGEETRYLSDKNEEEIRYLSDENDEEARYLSDEFPLLDPRNKKAEFTDEERREIVEASFQLMLKGDIMGYEKFRGSHTIENSWLNYLQKTLGNLFCNLISKSKRKYAVEFYNKNVEAKPIKVRMRIIGSDIISDFPEIPALPYDESSSSYTVYWRKRTSGVYVYSTLYKLGYTKKVYKEPSGRYEYYISKKIPAKKKGLYIIPEFEELVHRCLKRRTRFSVILLCIDVGHLNALIYDHEKRTLTRFEPHGAYSNIYDFKKLDTDLKSFVKTHNDLFSGGYFEPSTFCPIDGPQTKELRSGIEKKMGLDINGNKVLLEAGGFCSSWSLMFLHRRILYPNMTNKQISDMFELEPVKLSQQIRSYMAFIMGTVKMVIR